MCVAFQEQNALGERANWKRSSEEEGRKTVGLG